MAKFLFLVFTRPVEGQEAEYNRWYTEEHLDDVLKAEGFTAAQRFRITPHKDTPPGMLPPYMAIYEIEGDDPQAALADLSRRARTALMPVSPALMEGAFQFIATPISERATA